MAPDVMDLREAALALAPAERLQLAHELELSVASDEEKLTALRAEIALGDAAHDRGEYEDVPLEGLRAFLAGLVR